MVRSNCLWFIAVVVLLVSPLRAQVQLQPQPPENSSYRLETTARVDQKLTIAGMETDTQSENATTTRFEVGMRDASGKLAVKEVTESLKVTIGAMGANYTFDSTNPGNAGNSPFEALRDVHKAVARRAVTLIYGRDNRVEEVRLEEDILGGLPVATQDLVRSQLDPATLKVAINEQLARFPDQPVQPGDTWQRSESVNFGAGQVMTMNSTYTYAGTVEQDGRTLDKITSKVSTVDFRLENSPLPLTLKASKLTAEESDGTILFDRQRQQTVESQAKLRVKGELTFAINGMDLPSTLDLKMTGSTRVVP